MTNLQQLQQWVRESKNAVFFGGAGVSTESGIPDFRSVDGLYNQKYDYPPGNLEDTIVSVIEQCRLMDDAAETEDFVF